MTQLIKNSNRQQVPPGINRCLICLTQSTLSSDFGATLNIPGAGNCKLLNRQLEQLFIVQKLFDMPTEWCAQNMQMNQEQANREAVGKTKQNKWFQICMKCTKTRIRPAWDAYQKLLALEAKIERMKDVIKATMKDSILIERRNKRWSGMSGDGSDVEIRRRIFPELILGGLKKTNSTSVKSDNALFMSKQDDTVIAAYSPINDDSHDMDWEPPNDCFDDDNDVTKPLPKKRPAIAPKKRKAISSSTTSTAALRLIKRIRKRKPRPRELLKRFKCCQCGCYFHTDEELNSHTEAHELSRQNGGGSYDCVKCTFPAQNVDELQLHMKRRHGRVRSHRCPKCEFKCKNWKNLKAHIEAEHPDITGQELGNTALSLKCQVCSRQFLRLETFTIHQRKMHPELFGAESSEPLECSECGQRFMSKIKLQYHINNEHTEKPSKYVCDECGKGFEWKCRLENHMIVHINKVKRDYVCHLCGIDYAHHGLLNKHYRTVHPGETDIDGETSAKSEPGPSNAEEFKCRYCDLTSPYKVVILRHLKTHKEETGHRCDKCGNSYMSEQGLRRHLRINHPLTKENFPCPHCLKPFPSVDYMKTHVKMFCKLKHVEQPVSTFTLTISNENDTVTTESSSLENVQVQQYPQQYYQQQESYTDISEMSKVEMKIIFP